MADIELQSGDVILMLSTGPVSALIAWAGDSIYSHSALMADNGDLLEASAGGIRRYPLAKRLADKANVVFLDGFRSLDQNNQPLTSAARDAVVASGETFIGIPYEFGKLFEIGVLCAVRQKIPTHPLARFLVREALDHMIANTDTAMTCSEFVYNSFLKAKVQPAGFVTPEIIIVQASDLPFPDIDWVAFAKEMWELLHPVRPQTVQAHANTDMASLGLDIEDADLQSRINAGREKLGLNAGQPTALTNSQGAPIVVPNPNPKLVTPLDLAKTPSHIALGRLVQY